MTNENLEIVYGLSRLIAQTLREYNMYWQGEHGCSDQDKVDDRLKELRTKLFALRHMRGQFEDLVAGVQLS